MDQDDPAVLAAAEALWRDADYDGDDTWANGDPMPEEHLYRAEVVVAAYREYVLAHRPDAERWTSLRELLGDGPPPGLSFPEFAQVAYKEAPALLAALADETARAEAAEAETARLGRDWGHRTEKIIAERDAAVADADEWRRGAAALHKQWVETQARQ